MAELKYSGQLPSSEEFKQALLQVITSANPVDDLLELSARLHDFEAKYQMPSESFYQQYQAGMLNEELQHCIEWASIYRIFLKTKRLIESALLRAAVQPSLA
jgi:hypothetical protein